jgi:hypothetical protein
VGACYTDRFAKRKMKLSGGKFQTDSCFPDETKLFNDALIERVSNH